MHLIVMTEAAQGCPAAPPGQDLKGLIERWNPLMRRLEPAWSLEDAPDALNTLAERALARLVLGRPLQPDEDGRLPLTAWQEAAAPSDGTGATQGAADAQRPARARLTPFHGLVGSDRITLVPPAELALSTEESKALFEDIQPLFRSEGVELVWRSPLEWIATHDSLRGLPCASLARAQDDSVQRWQGRTPLAAARLLRRLQNEAQMVLHGHPVNAQRAARGELEVNSLWLDHAGATGSLAGEPPQRELVSRLQGVALHALPQADAPLQGWVGTALPLPTGEEPTVVWCGRHRAQAFTMRRLPAGWRGVLTRTLRRPPPSRPLPQWLAELDAAPVPDDGADGYPQPNDGHPGAGEGRRS